MYIIRQDNSRSQAGSVGGAIFQDAVAIPTGSLSPTYDGALNLVGANMFTNNIAVTGSDIYFSS
jgi:hypothetical protein